MTQDSKKGNNSSGNPERNWQDIMKEFDRRQRQKDRFFKEHNITMPERGFSSLSDDENDILRLVLTGTSVARIAEMFAVSSEIMEECINVIQAKIPCFKD